MSLLQSLSKSNREKNKYIKRNKRGNTPLENKIVFVSYQGKGYADSPRAIYSQMREDPRFKDYEFYWAVNAPRKKNIRIRGCYIIPYGSAEWHDIAGRARIIITNTDLGADFHKQEGQLCLHTWHGTPYRKEEEEFGDLKAYDKVIASSPYSQQILEQKYHVEQSRQLCTGYPRNDSLLNPQGHASLKEKLGIPEAKKVIIYAPVNRELTKTKEGIVYPLQADFEKWEKELGTDYVVLFKPHYTLAMSNFPEFTNSDFLRYIPAYKDITEYYSIADILITDYSSVMYDYALTGRPMYFYIPDYNPNLYNYDIQKKMPAACYKTEIELLGAVQNPDGYDYDSLKAFSQEFNPYEDGSSTGKVIDYIAQSIGETV